MFRVRWMAGLAMALVLAGSIAEAALPDAEQSGIAGYNYRLRPVAHREWKDDRACIKAAGRGLQPDPNTCVNTVSTKSQEKIDFFAKLYTTGRCTGLEPIQQGPGVGSNAHILGVNHLTHDLFGDPISGVISPGEAEAECQERAIWRATQLLNAMLKLFRICKKSVMRVGFVTDSATLEQKCLTPTIPDLFGKIIRVTVKLDNDVNAKCNGLTLAPLFSGLNAGCHANPAALTTCIVRRTGCRVCEALNLADGTARDCDEFDDDLDNGSCDP